ncbi:unnamed protein product [Linum trigynum]|uniref:Uncharacterized protein n=1 Tax=Linum trigynum TaxID=586398 RepID=A0AAV2FCS6_9ROSI
MKTWEVGEAGTSRRQPRGGVSGKRRKGEVEGTERGGGRRFGREGCKGIDKRRHWREEVGDGREEASERQ